MNICIIGAGNIGMYLGSYIALEKENKVNIYTSKPELFDDTFELIEEEKNLNHIVKFNKVTRDLEDAVKDADLILVTYPSFMVGKLLNEMIDYVKDGSEVGIIPGFGGAEFYKEKYLDKGCVFFGSQRVPSITRLKEYGKSVFLKQKNEFMKIGVFPIEKSKIIADKMTELIDINVEPLTSYLPITLSPSNPTMHPSRLYELFKNYKYGIVYEDHSLFYEGWGDTASKTLINLDVELHNIIEKLDESENLDFEKIKSRFKIENPSELTYKIRTAPGFIGIKTPMIKVENGFIPDLKSRYFLEDIEFGTCIIKGFAEVLNVETPLIDEIILWGQSLLNKEYIIDGKLKGKDSKNLLIPKNLGLYNKEDILRYYSVK